MTQQVTIHKKRRITIPQVVSVFFLFFLVFRFKLELYFIVDGITKRHDVYAIEILCVFLWLYCLCMLIGSWDEFNVWAKAYVISASLFFVYYAALSTVRMEGGYNHSDSFFLFRNILLLLSIGMFGISFRRPPVFWFKVILYSFLAISIGYYIKSVLHGTFSLRFQDYPVGYAILSLVVLPLSMYGLSACKKDNRSGCGCLLLATAFFGALLGVWLTASRLVFQLGLISLLLGFFFFRPQSNTAKRWLWASFCSAVFVFSILLYFDLFYCRENILRCLIYYLTPLPGSEDELMKMFNQYMEQRKLARLSGEYLGALYHNPPGISDLQRYYIWTCAIARLDGDWLFSLQGNAIFSYDFLGFTTTCGPHNFILDYALNFGLCGFFLAAAGPLILLGGFWLYWKRGGGGRIPALLWVLTIGPQVAVASLQATFCERITLSLFLATAVMWYVWAARRIDPTRAPRVCMLVTSGVVNDSRVLREAFIAAENGYSVLLAGRYDPELGSADPSWPFSVRLLDIPRAEGRGIFAKILERSRIGLALAFHALRFRPDIIHCNDFDTLPFGSLAAFFSSSSLVYDSHELWGENEIIARSPRGKKIVQTLERILARRCDAVICVSHASARWLREHYGLDNLTVVTNCPYAAGTERLPKNPGFEILTHGKLWFDRGCEEMIACSGVLGAHGVTVRIRGYGIRLEYYKELARQAGGHVVFSPKVPSSQVVSEASASHVGIVLTRPVSLSYALTVSNKLFECLMAGLPLILSDVPEHRMLNERYEFGLILDAMTPEALADAVLNLKNDPALYARLRTNAEKAARDLCWEKEGAKLVAIYRAVLADTCEAVLP